MNRLTIAKLVLAFAGIIVFGYGVSQDDSRARMAGIAIVGVAMVLRLFTPRGGSGVGRRE